MLHSYCALLLTCLCAFVCPRYAPRVTRYIPMYYMLMCHVTSGLCLCYAMLYLCWARIRFRQGIHMAHSMFLSTSLRAWHNVPPARSGLTCGQVVLLLAVCLYIIYELPLLRPPVPPYMFGPPQQWTPNGQLLCPCAFFIRTFIYKYISRNVYSTPITNLI